jgi:hypothetical protein
MDAKCGICGDLVAAFAEGEAPVCAPCKKRALRRRMIFDVSSSRPDEAKPEIPVRAAPEETRMLDLLRLVQRTRESLPPPRPRDEADAPLNVQEALRLADSLAPASPATMPPSAAAIEPDPIPPPPEPRARISPVKMGVAFAALGALLAMAVSAVLGGREAAPAAPDEPQSAKVEVPVFATPTAAPPPAAVEARASREDDAAGRSAKPIATGAATPRPSPVRGAATASPTASPTSKPAEPPAAEVEPSRGDLLKAINAAAGASPPAGGAATPPQQAAASADLPAFDRGAAQAALSNLAASISACGDGATTGRSGVTVTFAPGGGASQVTLDPGPLTGTAPGRCVVQVFRGAKVPPFSGSPVPVHRNVSLN